MAEPVTLVSHPPPEAAAGRMLRSHRLWLGLVGAELAVIYLPTVTWLYDRWTMSVWHNAHGLLIPFVVAYFIRLELKPLRGLGPQSSPWGFAFVVPALLLHVLDLGMHTQLLSAFTIVLLLPGLSLLFLGPARTRAIALPLAFLALMLPVPLALTAPIHLLLRQIATEVTAWILPVLGITAYTEGTRIELARASLIVSDACSGFSTLYAACAVAVLTAYNCPVRWRRLLVLGAAPPLAIAANVLRVILLVAVVDATGLDVLQTWVHPASGMATFALSLPILLWLGSDSRRV